MEAPGRILVVDDDALNRTLLQVSLEEQGYEVATAADGREALSLLRESAFDVVLLDLLMPEVDGYEVLATMKAEPALQHVPVIVISALGDMESVIRCIEMGATDHLPKPFDPVLLRARIGSSLAGKREHDLRQRYTSEIEQLAQQLKLRNRFITQTFGRYLSDEVVETLLASPDGLRLGGEMRTLTILISDMRGFTAKSELLSPDRVVRLVNNYLSEMTEVILGHGGTIDEFTGDGILAFFGAPASRPDDARRAIACALEMQKAMAQVNRANREDGLPDVEMGIGLNTGEVVVGNIGSVRRTKYGIVGRHVNLCARIESFTVGGQILMSSATLAAGGGDVVAGPPLTINAKGFADGIPVHELLAIGDEVVPSTTRDVTLFPLERPVPVSVAVLQEKAVGASTFPGALVRVGRHGAELRTPAAMSPFANLRLSCLDDAGRPMFGEIYAKVLEVPSPLDALLEAPLGAALGNRYRVHFTWLPAEAERCLAGALRAPPTPSTAPPVTG